MHVYMYMYTVHVELCKISDYQHLVAGQKYRQTARRP